MVKKIIVLGHNGMLGHMVLKVLSKEKNLDVTVLNSRFPNWQISSFDSTDFIINCIGAIPQKTNNFAINWEIPIWLEQNLKIKIIHPSTDCEIDNDNYGLSKKKASEFLLNNGNNTKIIKASIIGPEINSKASLFEWFLSQEEDVFGYTKAIWNGVTTYEWAKQCLKLINDWSNYNNLNVLSTDPISKYQLLNIIKKTYSKDINIIPKDLGKDKTLNGNIKTKKIELQLNELKNFYENGKN
jgi:dTDP-4-dehydrorhamnose reductase